MHKQNSLYQKEIDTPIGKLIAYTTNVGIAFLKFDKQKNIDTDVLKLESLFDSVEHNSNHQFLILLEKELEEYFSRKRKDFSVPLHFIGTDFQKNVWKSLVATKYGTTISYKQQAASIQKPESVRAVANANGANKILILVPCHRVIGTNGKLAGYSGEVWRKKHLLELEQGELGLGLGF